MPIKQGNPVNNVSTPTLRSKSPFKISFGHKSTQRFSAIDPIFVMDTVPNDDIKLAQRSTLHTYTLKAPMLNKLTKHMAYYSVPKSAILPHTWSKLFVNPKKGDDVVPEDVNAMFNPSLFLSFMVSDIAAYFKSLATVSAQDFISFFRSVVLLDDVFGADSIALKLRTPMVKLKNGTDSYEDRVIPCSYLSSLQEALSSVALTTSLDLGVLSVSIQGDATASIFRYDFNKYIGALGFVDFIDLISNVDVDLPSFSLSATAFKKIVDACFSMSNLGNFAPRVEAVNIQRICAYQLAMSSFATRDTVDDVYTSELYRQNMESLYLAVLGNVKTFNWNGVSMIYDWCSAAIIEALFSAAYTDSDKVAAAVSYFFNLFHKHTSLRYADLFGSCRTEPYAVGDTDIDVGYGDKVKVTDVVFNILKEKYLNLVNNVENTVARYSQAVFGVVPNNLPPEPYKHLACGLSADTASDKAVVREEAGIHPRPVVRDGVPHEYGIYLLSGNLFVLLSVPAEIRPVFRLAVCNGRDGHEYGRKNDISEIHFDKNSHGFTKL